ncbi:hypothetical protein T02_13420 [Trichinella nativa]|uniref:Uncharacterized protein n=1 Tax=Trichinella nativa TaxID=6335 RepID=A0A0V1KQP4_9BILA|nr:hypothetical protein T02_13420 [Trichinella nativa]
MTLGAGGNLHWPTILATGWLISWPTRLCHMTWQGHLRTCSPKYPRRRAVQHHDAVSVHLHSVNGQKRLGTTCISLLLRNPRLNIHLLDVGLRPRMETSEPKEGYLQA